jgi:hypothetical protein
VQLQTKVRQMNDHSAVTKAVATVRDVARMVGLSPARFYQLQRAGVFPWPLYDTATHRPHYTEEQQRQCLEVRRRNCGINGRPVLFYARRVGGPVAGRPRSAKKWTTPAADLHNDLIEGLKALGLASITAEQVGPAVRALFPTGTTGTDPGEVLRSLFMHLRRQNSGDRHGR